jgi:hypothetical protein
MMRIVTSRRMPAVSCALAFSAAFALGLHRPWRACVAKALRCVLDWLEDTATPSDSGGKEAACSSAKELLDAEDRATLPSNMLHEFKEISREVSVEKMMDRVRGAVLRLLPVQRATVMLVDEAAGVLRLILSTDAQTIALPKSKGIAGAVVTTGQAIVVDDAYADHRFDRSVDRATGYLTKSVLAVPVFAHDERRVVAVLQALNKRHDDGTDMPFSESDATLLEVLASLVSSLVARTSLVASGRRERMRAEAMLLCATALYSDADPRTKALKATNAVKLGCECERSSLFIVDAVKEDLFLIAHDKVRARVVAGLRATLSISVCVCVCVCVVVCVVVPLCVKRFACPRCCMLAASC